MLVLPSAYLKRAEERESEGGGGESEWGGGGLGGEGD